MIETNIIINKANLSLKYDSSNETLTGDNVFLVGLNDLGSEPSDNNVVTIEHGPDIKVSPVSFTIEPGINQSVSVRLADGVAVPEDGIYNFSLKIKSEYAADKELNLTLKSEPGEEEPEGYVYKLKYYIQRDTYRCNIYQNVLESVVLTPIEINGTVDLSYQDRSDLMQPIVSKNIKLKLECSLERDLSDLYTEDEKTFKVEIIKNEKKEFIGFMLPDSIWEDFVSDKWTMDITASDGLASLKNISFSNENGLNFFGRMTALNIFNICLNKTGLELPINVLCYIEYFEWAGYSILSSIYLSTERYFQNGNGSDSEPMDCESVMKSILQIFNACVVQHQGEWFIYRSLDIRSKNIVTRYINGIYDQNVLKEFGHIIGSHINNFEIFHCSGNQKKSIAASVQAYQVSYIYGNSRNILANGGLILEGLAGINIPGWSVFTAPDGLVDRGVRQGYGYGLRSAVRPFGSDPNTWPLMLSLNQSLTLKGGASMVVNFKFRNDGFNSIYFPFAVGVSNGTSTVWFDKDTGTWGNFKVNLIRNAVPYGPLQNNQFTGALDATFEMEVTVPFDGNLVVQVHRDGHGAGGLMGVHGISVSASDKNIKSMDYTGTRTLKKSTAVKPNVTVYNGDSNSDLFVGTIYKSDSDTGTEGWNRYYYIEQAGQLNKENFPEFKEILDINAEDNLRISRRAMTTFEGDFKGFIPYLTFFNIDGLKDQYDFQTINKKFQFLKYSYSFDNDITKMYAREYSDEYNFNDFQVVKKENFSNESKVTIKDV